ncbi:MAG TPA: TldD/PmbA family protein [Methanocella sp.]|nr:TldD/PmbA family protein [Methanocella sp.]
MKEELLTLANRVVVVAGQAGVQCEAFVQRRQSTSVVIEAGKVTFGSQDGDLGIGIRIINGHHTGYAYCTPDSIEYGVKQALSSARFGKPGQYRFHDSSRYNNTRSIFDNRIATMVTEDGVSLAHDMIEASSFDPRAIPSRGGLSFGTMAYAVANTNGASIFDEGTYIGGHVMTVLKDRDFVVNGDDGEISRVRDFSIEDVGRKATEKAVAQIGQRSIETAAMDVVLRPDAVFELFSSTVLPALYGDSIKKGESVYANKTGKQVTSSGLSIVDDGTHPRGINTFISDEEGYPSQRNVIVDRGILNTVLYDQFSAIESHAASTGNGMHTDRNESSTTYRVPPTTCARNIVFEGETMGEDEMIRSIKNGIIVEHVLGAHTANRVSGDFSVAIYAGYHVRDGQILAPLRGGMIGGNMPDMLLRASLANNYKIVESGMSSASGYVPSVRFEDVKVAGG